MSRFCCFNSAKHFQMMTLMLVATLAESVHDMFAGRQSVRKNN